MISPEQQSGWAGMLLESLEDTVTPTGYVVSWLQNNLGILNLKINGGFLLSGAPEGNYILPDMSQAESGIYSQMYICKYLFKKGLSSFGAAAYSVTEMRGDEQGTVKFANKNDIGKNYMLMHKDCEKSLEDLIEWYNYNSGGMAVQVLYGCRYGGANWDLLPPPELRYEYNFCWKL